MNEINPGGNISYPDTQICPGCYQTVRMILSPGGLLLCPRCGYSPTIGRKVVSSMTRSPMAFGPNINVRDELN